MSSETETRIGNLLNSSQSQGVSTDDGSGASSQGVKQLSADRNMIKLVPTLELDSTKEKLSLELKEKQEKLKVILKFLFAIFKLDDFVVITIFSVENVKYESYPCLLLLLCRQVIV